MKKRNAVLGLTGSILSSCLPQDPGEKLKNGEEIGVGGEAKRDSKKETGGNRNTERDREEEKGSKRHRERLRIGDTGMKSRHGETERTETQRDDEGREHRNKKRRF